MKNDKKIIPVFFATDDNYVPCLSVALESLTANASNENLYHIHVLYTALNKENIDSLSKYNKDNFIIFFNNVEKQLDKVSEKLLTRDYYTKAIYFRMFIPNLFPQYDKALYLDCDIVVNTDIAELFDFDLGNCYLGAVPDEIVQITPVFIDYVERFLKVKAGTYFNSGVLLFNLKLMRAEGFQEKFLDSLNNGAFIVAPDQDYLNTICAGKVSYLPREWNKMPIPVPDISEKDIKLVHYNLSFKPWHYNGIEYEKLFWRFASASEFFERLKELRRTYSDEAKLRDNLTGEKLKKLAGYFAYCGKAFDSYDFSPDSREQKEFSALLKTLI